MRPRAIAGLVGLSVVSFLAGGLADDRYGFPFGWLENLGPVYSRYTPLPGPGQSAYVPWYSNARGGEDAPRAEIRAGRTIDMKRCVTTMMMRQESQAEANQVCGKIVSGLGE